MAPNSKLWIEASSMLVFLLLASLCYPSSSQALFGSDPSSPSSLRRLLAAQRTANQIPNCSKMVSKSQCSEKPKCRWCTSEALDDMCFTKSEAWRLPQQVYTCD